MRHAGKTALLLVWAVLLGASGFGFRIRAVEHPFAPVKVHPRQDLGAWQGWGSSLAWWARAIGGTSNADYFADLIYTTKATDGYPGLGLNVVRYNVGGGGANQPKENKGPKLQWQMDIHGYWTDPNTVDPSMWEWTTDHNQRSLMLKARERGANVFEMFSDSPMWWMNSNHSTAGSDTGGDCLLPENYERFAFYLATVARYSSDHWGINFASVEPFNEPSADWWKYPGRQEGCHFDARIQQKIVAKLRSALDRAHLDKVSVAAADENNMDAGLSTWNTYNSETRALLGRFNVHGYSNGSTPYQGPNRIALRRAVEGKPVWQSEYGDGDASGYTMAHAIIHDLQQLQPLAWVYWQPVEPDVQEFGWGLINANYVDTLDQLTADRTPLVRVNRKFFVYGQFTRYLRPGYHLIVIEDPNSIAAYDSASRKLVIVKLTGDVPETGGFDLSEFSGVGDRIEVIATTTVPGDGAPDWKQHDEALRLEKLGGQKLVEAHLYPKSIYTFVVDGISR